MKEFSYREVLQYNYMFFSKNKRPNDFAFQFITNWWENIKGKKLDPLEINLLDAIIRWLEKNRIKFVLTPKLQEKLEMSIENSRDTYYHARPESLAGTKYVDRTKLPRSWPVRTTHSDESDEKYSHATRPTRTVHKINTHTRTTLLCDIEEINKKVDKLIRNPSIQILKLMDLIEECRNSDEITNYEKLSYIATVGNVYQTHNNSAKNKCFCTNIIF